MNPHSRPPLGQHFLADPSVVQTILAAANLSPSETALEIGPGQGVLTFDLAQRVKRLVAVELDTGLAERLRARLASKPSVTISNRDILKADLPALFPAEDGVIKVVGNLPYAITSPIFEKLLAWPRWETGVFLIQREVAERMHSAPGSKTFGILSLAIQLFAEVELLRDVPPEAFRPPPRVTSEVVRLRRKPRAELPDAEIPAFFDLAHGAFAHRRKTLANSLAFHSGIPKESIEKWLREQGVEPNRRAESLGLEIYLRCAGAWSIFRREIKLTSPETTSTIPEL